MRAHHTTLRSGVERVAQQLTLMLCVCVVQIESQFATTCSVSHTLITRVALRPTSMRLPSHLLCSRLLVSVQC